MGHYVEVSSPISYLNPSYLILNPIYLSLCDIARTSLVPERTLARYS